MPRDGSKWVTGANNAITDVPGIRVGHQTDRRGATGCTVILSESTNVAAVDTRGGAPGTRETALLGPAMLVQSCHAVVFAGGSAFGLAAADGVMRFLSEKGIGFKTNAAPVPIVASAIIFDLGIGSPTAHPDAAAGYLAAGRAKRGKVAQGSVGAGTGATCAKVLGPDHLMKGGLGTASIVGPRGLIVGALAVVNPVGIVIDPDTANVVAGPRAKPRRFVPLLEALERRSAEMDVQLENTTLVCIATNADIDHRSAHRLAMIAHDGIARAILPAHTFGDGDVTFALATGAVPTKPHDVAALGVMTVRAVEQAILNGIRSAEALHGIPSITEWANA